MMDADFYLASNGYRDFEEPRRCVFVRRMSFGQRTDGMLLEIEPPLIGQKYGLGARDIHLLIVAPRHVGVTIFPLSTSPLSVFVMRSLVEDVTARAHVDLNEVELIAWADLYLAKTEPARRDPLLAALREARIDE